MAIDFATAEQNLPEYWLYRYEDRSPFAYSRGLDFVRYDDHSLWARLWDDRLVSVWSADDLAYRVGSVFYDTVSREPIYYFPASLPSLDSSGRPNLTATRLPGTGI